MLKEVPLFVSALTADNEAQFQKIVKENIVSWMVSFRAENDLATGYMPGNKFSQKSTRGAFLSALKRAIGQYQSGDGVATGTWLLPCGLTAAGAVAYVTAQYDENGIRMDAIPSKPVLRSKTVLKKLHVQHESKPKWVCRLGRKPQKAKAPKMTRHEVRQLFFERHGAPVDKQDCPKAKAERAAQVALQTEQNKEKKSSRQLRQLRTALKAEAEIASRNRDCAAPVGFSIVDQLDRYIIPTVFRTIKSKGLRGEPVRKVIMVDAHASPEELQRMDYVAWWQYALNRKGEEESVTVLHAPEDVVAKCSENARSPIPEPWQKKPKCKDDSEHNAKQTEPSSDRRVGETPDVAFGNEVETKKVPAFQEPKVTLRANKKPTRAPRLKQSAVCH